ncbi:type 1 periplasmic-binding domain-containing protein [Nocardiopsis suaedae]|uniref:ABC transporter substrate-binding protein n=1 Tax=Nocardiopsis suaedae TaxID=3018444 RepID=A0ABT4TQX9_9ACTN|nr:hypothetical protein [Nocardiopsis suaedae]MDA2807088.1 hypothetical protein [Nocardiopsis suaedae]
MPSSRRTDRSNDSGPTLKRDKQVPAWWRRWWFRLSVAGLALVLVVSAAWWAVPRLLCGGEAGLVRVSGECVGVTDGSYLFPADRAALTHAFPAGDDGADAEFDRFAEDFREVQEGIAEQNAQVAASGDDYVTVAFLAPLSPRDDRSFDHTRLLSSLWGVLAAQQRINGSQDFYDPAYPAFQVLLANEGDRQEHWRHTADELVALSRDADHPLVTAFGMPLSSQATQDSVALLSDAGVPMVGGAAATDELNREGVPGFVRASPGVSDFTAALSRHLAAEDLDRAMTVYDDAGLKEGPDRFVDSLRNAYARDIRGVERLSQHSFTGHSLEALPTPRLFSGIARKICSAAPDLVLFAGRTNDLEGFIGSWAAQERDCRADIDLTIAFMTTGLTVSMDGELMRALEEADARLVLATTVDPAWVRGADSAPEGYALFEEAFIGAAGEDAVPTLVDGYAAMAHDALAVTAKAVRTTALEIRESGAEGEGLPLSAIIAGQEKLNTSKEDMVVGAGGTLSFSDGGDGSPEGKPVPVVELPADKDGAASEDYYTTGGD